MSGSDRGDGSRDGDRTSDRREPTVRADSRPRGSGRPDRRVLIGAAGVGAVAALAGCNGDLDIEPAGDGSSDEDEEDAGAEADEDEPPEPTSEEARAIGRGARVRHPGAVVIGDGTSAWIASKGPNEVRSQSPFYAPAFHATSARTAKTDLDPVEPGTALDAVADLPISRWRFDAVDDGPHLGPMAGDFRGRVGLDAGGTIASVDADGAILAAIRGLDERLADERRALRAERERLDEAIESLEARLKALEERP